MTPRRLVQILEKYRFGSFDRASLCRSLAEILKFENTEFDRSPKLAEGVAVDFMLGRTALHVVTEQRTECAEALERILAEPNVDYLVVATHRSRLLLPTGQAKIFVAHLLRAA